MEGPHNIVNVQHVVMWFSKTAMYGENMYNGLAVSGE